MSSCRQIGGRGPARSRCDAVRRRARVVALRHFVCLPPSAPCALRERSGAARGRGASLSQRQREVEVLASAGGDARVVVVGREHQLQCVNDVLPRLFACAALAHRARHLNYARDDPPSSSGSSYAIVIWSFSFIAQR